MDRRSLYFLKGGNSEMKWVYTTLMFTLMIGWNPGMAQPVTMSYPGQKMPGDKAQVFAPATVSTGLNERDMAVSPDGKLLLYSVWENGQGYVLMMKRTGDTWTGPELAGFSGTFSDIEPCFGPDGKLYFVSDRGSRPGPDGKKVHQLYVTMVTDGKWTEPRKVNLPVPEDVNIFYPSFTSDGALYFTAELPDTIGGEDLYVCTRKGDNFNKPVNLGPNVNTAKGEFNACVSRDGSFIIFTSTGWGRGLGGGDLWISFKDNTGKWKKPVNMGTAVNSPSFEYCPSISPDGKVLFFTSRRAIKPQKDIRHYVDLVNGLNRYGNGRGDIYWVSTNVIQQLKTQNQNSTRN